MAAEATPHLSPQQSLCGAIEALLYDPLQNEHFHIKQFKHQIATTVISEQSFGAHMYALSLSSSCLKQAWVEGSEGREREGQRIIHVRSYAI